MSAHRSISLDVLRIFAALWVLVFHWTTSYPSDLLPGWFMTFARGGFLGVDLFFLLSGAVIVHTAFGKRWDQFGAARFLRLFPAFFGVNLLIIMIAGFTSGLTTIHLTSLTGLSFWYRTQELIAPAWTLGYEVGFYVLVAIGIAITGGGRLTRDQARLGIAIVLVAQLVSIHADFSFLGTITGGGVGAQFMLGALLGLSTSRDELQKNLPAIFVATGMVIFTLRGRTAEMGVEGAEQLIWIFAVLVGGFLPVLWSSLASTRSAKRIWWASPIKTFALMTYPIYLLHFDIGFWVIEKLRDLGVPAIIALGTSFGTVMLLSWLSVRAFEPWARGVMKKTFGWDDAYFKPNSETIGAR